MSATSKSCLVITYGPVPTSQYQTIEGGGMRAWGLAQGLKANGLDVTVGVNSGFPQELTEYEGIRLVNWSLDAAFTQLINSFDAVVVSYCMGDPSVFIADNLNEDVQLILDAYVPIYIEISARDSKDIETEYTNYMADIGRFNKVLKRGDYFLYANDAQELLYSGVLSALGVINPSSYRTKRLIKAPFGIHRLPVKSSTNPYKTLGIAPDDFVVLWFGGIYPWFRVEEYLAAIRELSADKHIKFVFVGGKNPFNPNPDFSRQYDIALMFAQQHKLTNRSVFFVDWVDFDKRVDWYAHASIIVSINQPGEENKYSWRTRVMDYIWGEVATISNGGDPLSEELIANEAAFRVPELTTNALIEAIKNVRSDPQLLRQLHKNVITLKNKYSWDVVTAETASLIKAGKLPFVAENPLRELVGAPSDVIMQGAVILPGRARRVAALPVKMARKMRQKGILRTARLASSVAKTHINSRRPGKRHPQFVFISNPINNTGAPIVLLQIIEEYVKKYGANRVRLIAPGVDEPKQKEYLRKLGVTAEQAVFGIGLRFIRLQLNLQKDDVVIMNTAAIYDNYRDFILLWLKNGRLDHAYWFIHEDIAQLPIVHKEFLDKHNLERVVQLAKSGSLDLLLPSKRTAAEYDELLGTPVSKPIKLRVEVDAQYMHAQSADNFNEINFLLSGTAGDGRKGQILALSALHTFIKDYYEKSPNSYRPFKLHLVAVDKIMYISQQIRWISKSQLGKYVNVYESLPKADALAISASCNAVICCSLNETFGLYIAEGMLMGHVLLRNNSAGVDEQLVDGENGFLIDHTDIKQFASKIEKLLNKKNLSNAQLQAMSEKSQKIITSYSKNTYLDQIESLR